MSYAEVERGLPPVNQVSTPLWKPKPAVPPKPRRPLLASETGIESDSSVERAANGGGPVTPSELNGAPLYQNSGPRPPSTQRYIIQENEDEMKVFKVEQDNSNLPKDFYISGQAVSVSAGPGRVKRCCGCLSSSFPAGLFVLALHLVKYWIPKEYFHVMGLTVFPSVFGAGVLAIVLRGFGPGSRGPIFQALACSKEGGWNWIGLMVVSILSVGALLLQIVSAIYLDITVALGISFTALVIVSFLRHINREKSLSFELLLMTLMAYLGLTLIAIPSLLTQDRRYQDQMHLGIGAGVGSMMLTIPASLLLQHLRQNKVEESIMATAFGLFGTIVCLVIGLVIGFKASSPSEAGILAAITVSTFLGTVFLFLESRVRARLEQDGPRVPRPAFLQLSCTRLWVFIGSGLVELVKRGFAPWKFFVPSAYSIFGVLLLMLSYMITVGFESWFDRMRRLSSGTKGPVPEKRHFLPWLFSKK